MDSHNLQRRCARVAHHAEDTVALFGNCCQSMLHRWIAFIWFAPVRFCDRSFQPRWVNSTFVHPEPRVIAQFVLHNFNSVTGNGGAGRVSQSRSKKKKFVFLANLAFNELNSPFKLGIGFGADLL